MHSKRVLALVWLLVLTVVAGSRAQQAGKPEQSPQAQQPSPQQSPAPAQNPPTGPTPPAAPGAQSTVTVNVNLVDVLFTVLNRRNKLVPELDKSDFKIFDDSVQQEIRYFSKQTDLPLRIGMLLDTSNSIRDRLKFEQD